MEGEINPKVTVVHAEQHEAFAGNRFKRRRVDISSLANSLSIERLVGNFAIKTNDLEETSTTKANSSANILTLLKQSVQSGDPKILSLCITETQADQIEEQILLFGSEYQELRPKLICALIKLYLAKPNKSSLVLSWLNISFRLFGRLIVSNPDVVESLGRLYAAINIRLKSKSRLEKLRGKVDFLLSQIEHSKSTVAKTSKKKPKKSKSKSKGKAGTDSPLVEYTEKR